MPPDQVRGHASLENALKHNPDRGACIFDRITQTVRELRAFLDFAAPHIKEQITQNNL
jgi:hypothetical protein